MNRASVNTSDSRGSIDTDPFDYLIRSDQQYNDKREALIQALEAGEKSGVSKRTLDEIWKGNPP